MIKCWTKVWISVPAKIPRFVKVFFDGQKPVDIGLSPSASTFTQQKIN